MLKSNTTGPSGNFDMAAFERAKAAVDAIMPTAMTVVTHPAFQPGMGWEIRERAHVYMFVSEADIWRLPSGPVGALGYGGVPVRKFEEPEMREVFMRALERLADTTPP